MTERISRVRELARDYANDQLSFNDYRVRRRRLIDRIVENAEPLREATPHHTISLRRLDGKLGRQAVAVTAGVIVVALIAWSFWPATPSRPQENTTAAPYRADTLGTRLIKTFLHNKNWQHASLVNLRNRWQALGVTQRAATRHTVWYRRLNAALYDRLNQQRALAPLDGSGDAQNRADQLRTLARALAGSGGFEHPRTGS